jgi:hypothetical protein
MDEDDDEKTGAPTWPALTQHPACQVPRACGDSAMLSLPRVGLWPAHAKDGPLRAVYSRMRGGGPTAAGRVHSDFSATSVHRGNKGTPRSGQRACAWTLRSATPATQLKFAFHFSKLPNSKKCQHTRKSPKIKVVGEL